MSNPNAAKNLGDKLARPGKSGNPSGRPKDVPSLLAAFRRELSRFTDKRSKRRRVDEFVRDILDSDEPADHKLVVDLALRIDPEAKPSSQDNGSQGFIKNAIIQIIDDPERLGDAQSAILRILGGTHTGCDGNHGVVREVDTVPAPATPKPPPDTSRVGKA